MLIVCRLLGRKVVLHIHDGRFEEFYRHSPLKACQRFALNHAGAVFTVSAHWRSFIQTICRAPVYEVPNCAAPEFFAESPLEHSGQGILFVGRLSRAKGAADLLEAMRLVREQGFDNRLLLAGGGSLWWEMEAVRERIDELGLSHVEIVTAEGPEELFKLLSQSALFVLPSYAEGLPVSMLEAMAYGLPVVVSTAGGIPDAVTDGENGFLVPPGDTAQLATRITCLLADPGLRQKMGAANAKLAALRYHADRTAEIMAGLYRELLESGG